MVNLVEGLDDSYQTQEGLELSDEVDDLLQRIGWEGLAIAAHSEAFRRILSLDQEVDSQLRREVLEALKANRNSLEFYGRVRNIDWRGLLLPYSNDSIRYMSPALKLVKKFWDRHPHELAIPPQGEDHVITPNYNNCRQVNITKNIWNPADWKHQVDPKPDINVTMRWAHVYDLGCCDFCESPHACRCQVQSMPGELVELVKTEDRGIGVRALWPFRKGDVLGEYVGRLIPDGSRPDQTYALAWEAPSDQRTQGKVSVDACYEGNWTRFVNHACENASTEYRCRTFSDHAAMTLEATRDIEMYEEITVDYGPSYWKKRQCRCGSPKCYSAKQPPPTTREEARPLTGRARKTEKNVMRIPLKEIGGEEGKDVAEETLAEEGNAGDDSENLEGGGGEEEVLCPDPSSNVVVHQDPSKNNDGDGDHPEKDDHKDKNYVPGDDSDGDDDDAGPMVVGTAEVMELGD
ncbi:SET domain-containing protein [Aspergillus violaceofuscus CBS 115571]|uniref:SET domain-containing protein n=2 Tax=Aspergillus TaxID=5052 RepID=A0A2V5HT26_ASPV1|nr:SET domain-containing protein [Aspergillus violaceofuscus CBS 115571]